jgi:hypothetical protein
MAHMLMEQKFTLAEKLKGVANQWKKKPDSGGNCAQDHPFGRAVNGMITGRQR